MKLESKESAKLWKYKEKIEKTIFGYGIGIPIFLLVVSFIPAKFIPHRNAARVSDGDASLAELIGVIPLILIVIGLSVGLVLYLMSEYKYLKISADVIERKKVIFKGNVQNVVIKKGAGLKEIELFISPPYKNNRSIEFIDFPNFPRLTVGQEVEIEATVNALYPLKITPLGFNEQVDADLQKALDILKNLKKK